MSSNLAGSTHLGEKLEVGGSIIYTTHDKVYSNFGRIFSKKLFSLDHNFSNFINNSINQRRNKCYSSCL